MHPIEQRAADSAHPVTRLSRYAPYAAALAVELAFSGYVKDDAYIEYRYARNLAAGHGLVFNVGTTHPVEGFTSFLWTAALALPARLGLDLLPVAKLIGGLAVLGVIAAVGRLILARGGSAQAATVGRWVMATSASLLVWGQSGMEPALAALCVVGGVLALARGRLTLGLVILAIGAGVRPEIHLVLGLALLLAIARARRQPQARRDALFGIIVAAALLLAMHGVRLAYYGSLIPNTALVKTASFSLTAGLRSLGELAATGLSGVLIAVALARAWQCRDDLSWLVGATLVGFALYLVRVGRDEMILSRLYLPALPLAVAWAAPALAARRAGRRLAAIVCLSGLAFAAAYFPVARYRALGDRSYAPLADVMEAHAHPGDFVVFQDLGRTPYEAMSLRFVDPIGLVDHTIAEILHRDGSNPFIHPPSPAAARAIRDHLFALSPRLIALVAYIAPPDRAAVRRRFDANERESLLAPFARLNSYQIGLDRDPRFAAFRFVDAWRRDDGYYLLLYERRPPLSMGIPHLQRSAASSVCSSSQIGSAKGRGEAATSTSWRAAATQYQVSTSTLSVIGRIVVNGS